MRSNFPLVTAIALVNLIFMGFTFSQPLNGSFTVGGPSPVFATLQEAADALKSNGV